MKTSVNRCRLGYIIGAEKREREKISPKWAYF